MRKYSFFSILICISFTIMTYSCEKSADQTTTSTVAINEQLASRTVNACEDCPNVTDCCCSVELQDPDGGSATLRLCGTSDGIGSCSGSTSGCPSFSGGGQLISLSTGIGNYRKLFCLVPGNSFWIQNAAAMGNAAIKVSCQHGLTNPQIIPLTLTPSQLQNYTSSGCVLTACP